MGITTDKFRISIFDEDGGESALEISALGDKELAELIARANACFGHLLKTMGGEFPRLSPNGNYVCPSCGCGVEIPDQYCRRCGQKLLWAEVDGNA